jgi:hypothetical protein
VTKSIVERNQNGGYKVPHNRPQDPTWEKKDVDTAHACILWCSTITTHLNWGSHWYLITILSISTVFLLLEWLGVLHEPFEEEFQTLLGLWGTEGVFTLRAALHYGGEGHQLVKNFSPRHGYLRQGMVCRRRCKDNKKDVLRSLDRP